VVASGTVVGTAKLDAGDAAIADGSPVDQSVAEALSPQDGDGTAADSADGANVGGDSASESDGGSQAVDGGDTVDSASDSLGDLDADATPVCLAAAATCLDGIAATCATDGLQWIALAACPTGSVCAAGACQTQLCSPNEAFCEGSTAKLCAADGLVLAAAPTDCAAQGKLCVAGACEPKPCGNGQLQPGEECDDGNSDSGDGCSGACQSEWKVLLSQDFSGVAAGWTPCAGCSAGGCPSAKSGAMACAADWTRVCMPLPDYTAGYARIRMQFSVHAEIPMNAFWIASGPLDGWNDQSPRIGFDGIGGGVTLAGKNVKAVGVSDFLPAMPFTLQLAIEIELATGKVWVQKAGAPLAYLGAVELVSTGPWVWNMATNYACCNGSLAASWFDDFSFSGVPK
jgi:cysteine-rich repeat protein